jgi:lysophospholipase L1-like esterase
MRRLCGALCAIVIVLGGCGNPDRKLVALAGDPNPQRVAIVGDSITVSSTPQIKHALEGRYTTDIHARPGQRIDQMLVDLHGALAERPNAVVVNLGTNDVLQGDTQWHSSFDRMIADLAGQPCVQITTISTRVTGWVAVPAIAEQINRAIAETAASRAQFHIVDWNAAVHTGDGTQLLVADHVHPSAAGEARLASLIRSALDRNCGRDP